MFGKCKVCAEKDKRISSLEDQVAFLRDLAHPRVDNENIPASNHEANGVLDALQEHITIETRADAAHNLSEEEIAEREALLGGTY